MPTHKQVLGGIRSHHLRIGNPTLSPLIAGQVQLVTAIAETTASEMITAPASAVLPARSLVVSAGEN